MTNPNSLHVLLAQILSIERMETGKLTTYSGAFAQYGALLQVAVLV